MPDKNLKRLLIVLMLVVACGAAAFFVHQNNAVNTVVTMEAKPNNVYDRTLRVVADIDYDPYTFTDESRQPCGHDIELIYELANRMGYNVDIRLTPWGDALEAVRGGEADMILTLPLTPTEYPELQMSIPIVNDPFIAFGRQPFSQIGELYGKRIAVMEGTGCISEFIEPYHLLQNTRFYASNTEAFKAVLAGECDYAVARYSVGRRAIANLPNGQKLQAAGPTLLNNFLCIGVPGERTELLNELNDAIVTAYSDGTLSRLSYKWLGHYVRTLSIEEYLRANSGKLIHSVSVLALAFLLVFLILKQSMAHKKEESLKQLAERDQLTGLYNRVSCERFIRQKLSASDAQKDVHALLVIDVDNFKSINDTFGHMEGDAVLAEVAAGLGGVFRAGDIVGRLGGDEFFAFLLDCKDEQVPAAKAEQIREAFSSFAVCARDEMEVSVSVGIAMYPWQGTSFSDLYKASDDAMYEVKRRGKSGYAMYGRDGKLTIRQYPA